MQEVPDSFYIDCLDKLGYSKELSEKRVKIYDNAADSFTKVNNRNWPESVYIIIAGSRGEGLSVSLDSDMDLIFVQPAIKCFETYPTAESVENENYAATFQLDLANVPEGYTKLKLRSTKAYIEGLGSYHQILGRINKSLTDNKYLKSGLRLVGAVEYGGRNLRKEGWLSENYIFDETHGPAQPLKLPLPFPDRYLSVDFVQAFPCSYPSIFDEWCKRERKYDWPSTDVLNAVKETDVFVVSVGHSGSKDENLQWRISSTPAERLLVRAFSDSQIKLYATMKMLVKHELKPLCSNITSYIVKNVIFWVFEEQSGLFQIDEFFVILSETLKYLKESIHVGCLPHYMIPTRNLLEGKISKEEKGNLIDRLDDLIKEGSSSLLRCPVINNMLCLPADEMKERLLSRELADQLGLALLSMEPPLYDEIEHSLHLAKTPADVLKIYRARVLPVVKASNPFEYFTLLKTMTDAEIFSRMIKGYTMGYDKVWMD